MIKDAETLNFFIFKGCLLYKNGALQITTNEVLELIMQSKLTLFFKEHLHYKFLDVIRRILDILPIWILTKKERWIRTKYWQFGQDQRDFIFMSIARFLHINRPVTGYYFEFGCNEANTMRKAWDHFHHLFDFTFVGFDSFEGLPEIADIDRQLIWEKGKLAFAEKRFIKRVIGHGMPANKLRTVRGFYENSLSVELKETLLPTKAAVIYIDCDLYISTVPVLEWMVDFLQVGTVIVFDDWYCFHGDPQRGEQLAWNEFRKRNPQLRFSEFVRTNEAASFIFVGRD